jgi:chemotaxis protein MotB
VSALRGTPRSWTLAALLAVAAGSGCGVPKDQHDAAVAAAEAKAKADAKADSDAKLAAAQQEIEALKGKLTEAEGKRAAADEATRAELDELRKQKAAAEARLKLFEDFIAKFKKMIEAGKLDILVRRGQIVLALGTDILFDTGKVDIKPEGRAALLDVADALKSVSGRRFQIAGHTDNVPIKKDFPSNWELSTARAIAVVKLLVERGVKSDVLSAAGYAEFDPAQSNATEKGKSKNRRIEIVIVPNVEDLVKMPDVAKTKATGASEGEDATKEQPASKPPETPPPPTKPKPAPAKPAESKPKEPKPKK